MFQFFPLQLQEEKSMTFEELLAEGRKLERHCVFLRSTGTGSVAAVWYDRDYGEIESTGYRCWLTVDARHVPCLPSSLAGYISVFTNQKDCVSGRIEVTSSWPKRAGTALYAHPASVLPPIEAVFALGSQAVGEWLASNEWDRREFHNTHFRDSAIVEPYKEIWTREYPIYFRSDIHAVLGGWHFPWDDGDWHHLIDEQLIIFTLRNSEPWVEAWRTKTREFKVVQRIT
jgi:hypothetical protein